MIGSRVCECGHTASCHSNDWTCSAPKRWADIHPGRVAEACGCLKFRDAHSLVPSPSDAPTGDVAPHSGNLEER